MNEQTRAEVLRIAGDLIEAEMRNSDESPLNHYWQMHQGDAATGCWYPYDELEGIEFDRDIDIVKNVWYERRIKEINDGSDPTAEEVRQWQLEYGKKDIFQMSEILWWYVIFPIPTSTDAKGYVLLIEPTWHSFDHYRPRPQLLGAFGSQDEAITHLKTLGVV